jgi:hypothetical protein
MAPCICGVISCPARGYVVCATHAADALERMAAIALLAESGDGAIHLWCDQELSELAL